MMICIYFEYIFKLFKKTSWQNEMKHPIKFYIENLIFLKRKRKMIFTFWFLILLIKIIPVIIHWISTNKQHLLLSVVAHLFFVYWFPYKIQKGKWKSTKYPEHNGSDFRFVFLNNVVLVDQNLIRPILFVCFPLSLSLSLPNNWLCK